MTQPTPGLWKAIKGVSLDTYDDDPNRWSVAAAGNDHEYLIATIENGQPGDCLETEGQTAHLIAAAPDLYKAVSDSMEYLRMTLGPCDPDCECILHALDAALAKAEGRQP